MSEKIRIQLSHPTVLPDLNKADSKDEGYAREYIEVLRMRYGHIKEMQNVKPEEQTQWVIRKLTGLSENDMDQLFAEDAAEITKTIFGFIETYFGLAKKMWTNPEAQAK